LYFPTASKTGRFFRVMTPLVVLGASCLAQNPVGQIIGPDASVKGSVMFTSGGTGIMSGSTVSAGHENAMIRLSRGGEVRLCRGSAMSLTSSANGNELMMGLSSGTIETHYRLATANDSIMTPDFQIQLLGPGSFNFAISADERGNTCVQSLGSNSGSLRVTELMGDGVYEVKPSDQVFFRGGKVSNVTAAVGSCGCGVMPRVMQASTAPPANPESKVLSTLPVPESPLPITPAHSQPTTATAVIVDTPKNVHVEVDAPFVFRASDPRPVPEAPFNMARLYISGLPALPAAEATPPPGTPVQRASAQEKPRKKKKSVWGFLASIFRG